MAIAESEIYAGVRQVVVEALAVEDDAVTPDARLTADLGAESIDYLDIAFQLERKFGVKIDAGEITPSQFATDENVRDGRITDAGMDELRRRLPFARFDALEATRDLGDFLNIFTVESFVGFVRAKLEQREASAEP